MLIERIEVEGGFLDGLDLRFGPGLNVLIGPRGVGKTSVIELIRFCLEVPGFTQESHLEAKKHALSVLGDGRVTVTLNGDGEAIRVTRSGEEEHARQDPPAKLQPPSILSQKEIELIGRDALGRLRLIDSFRTTADETERAQASVRARIASLTQEMQALAQEVDVLEGQLHELRDVPAQLAEASQEEAAIRGVIGESDVDQKRLERLNTHIAERGVQLGVTERAMGGVGDWRQRIEDVRSLRPIAEAWPGDTTPTAYANLSKTIESADGVLLTAATELAGAKATLLELTESLNRDRIAAQDEARTLRRELDEIKAGAGAVSRRIADLQESAGQMEALRSLLAAKRQQLGVVQKTRHAALDELDALRDSRFEERHSVVDRLNKLLGPSIEIRVVRDGLHSEYASAIAASLRGSGIHYNTLAPLLAARMSPRELAEAVESGDTQKVSELGEITPDRAQRAVAWIREYGTHDILTSELDDAVSIALLDGTEMKPSDEVSTGQRCTAILPVLLSHESQVLVIDQPEDHLDNSFIVSTVVVALLAIGTRNQMLFSTHNANIPVLGNASSVVLLGSDGSRGFRVLDGPLTNPAVVDAITTVMEGGRDAFAQRAAFYASQSTTA